MNEGRYLPFLAEEKLMPASAPRIPRDSATELRAGGSRDGLAVLFGAGGVPQRLMAQIAPVPDQLPEERDTLIRPPLGRDRLWNQSGDRQAVTRSELGHRDPAPSRE